jgi:hypothetical protein
MTNDKKLEGDKSLVGKYIDVNIDDVLELGLYITDFKPDLEGVDCADVVIYYNDPDAIALIGKKPGDVIISDEQKTIVLGIRDKSNEIDESFFGLIEMKDKKSIDFYLGWKNYDILKAFFKYLLLKHSVFYYKLATPGIDIKDRNIPIEISKKVKSCEDLFLTIDNRRVQGMKLVFSNGIRINFTIDRFELLFYNKFQRNKVFERYTSMQGIEKINFNNMKMNKIYYLQKKGQPKII